MIINSIIISSLFFLQPIASTQKKDIPLRTKVNIGMPYLEKLDVKTKIKPQFIISSDRSDNFPILEFLVNSSDVIAIGKFEGVMRYAYSPFSAKNVPAQNTLFAFKVERYLKGKDDGFVKIFFPGGPLPWIRKETGATYVGWVDASNPIPSVGDRYIVFLERPDTRMPAHRELGYVSKLMNDGKHEVTQFLDEYNFTSALQGKILLRQGSALSGDLSGNTENLHWRFPFGKEQIIDISEAESIRVIQNMVRHDYAKHRGTTRYKKMPPPP